MAEKPLTIPPPLPDDFGDEYCKERKHIESCDPRFQASYHICIENRNRGHRNHVCFCHHQWPNTKEE